MHGLVFVSVCILCSACILFSGEVQCKMHSTCNIVFLPSTTHFSIQGNSLYVTSEVDCWVGKGVDQRTFGSIATPYHSKLTQSNHHRGLEECEAASAGKSGDRCQKIRRTIRMRALAHYIGRQG